MARRLNSRRVIIRSSLLPGQTALNLGSGTGISTLELFSQKLPASVIDIESSDGMLLVAKYKFHQDGGKSFLKSVNNKKLLRYWRWFRTESIKYKNLVTFIQDDFQTINSLKPESVDGAVAVQFMHWTNIVKSFAQLKKCLKIGGEIVWDSASHFFNDKKFPAAKYGFRYNDFLAYVLEEVCSKGKWQAKDYRTLSKPPHSIDTIKEITASQGLETTHLATYLNPVDFLVFAQNHVPVFVQQLIISKTDPEELEKRIREAIGKAVVNPKALKDTEHKYDIVPVFKSVKLK